MIMILYVACGILLALLILAVLATVVESINEESQRLAAQRAYTRMALASCRRRKHDMRIREFITGKPESVLGHIRKWLHISHWNV